MTTGRPRQPVTRATTRRPPFVRRAWDAVRYGIRLTLLTLFGPARLDDTHDPIARLKRERARQVASYTPDSTAPAAPASRVVSVAVDADHAERLRFERAVASAGTERRRLLWDDAVRRWGPAEASRIWQEALSAEDASQT